VAADDLGGRIDLSTILGWCPEVNWNNRWKRGKNHKKVDTISKLPLFFAFTY